MEHRWPAVLLVAITCAFHVSGAEPQRLRPAVDGSLKSAARSARPAEESATVDLIVRFRQPARGITANAIASRRETLEARLGDLRRDVAGLGIRRTYHRVLLGASVRVPRESRASIAALPYVASVHEDRRFQTFLNETVPWIRAPKVWTDYGTRGAGVTVAVIDTGIDYTHPALGGGIGPGFKVIGGWDFFDNDDDPMDESGHGTHVAGIIAADSDGVRGVAPDVKLLAYRVLDPNGGSETDVIAAIERAVDPDQNGDPSDHVDIVNMSLGGIARTDDPVSDAVEAATAAGVLFTISAGNSGWYGYLPTPAIAPSAIAVGASDNWDRVADFSSRGPSFDFGIKPEVVAPGVGIISTVPQGKTAEFQGTSMAAPHAAGVAALVKAMHPDWSPAQIKSAIVTTSLPLNGDIMNHGAGRIDAMSATSVSTLASPVAVNFGQLDVRSTTWTESRTVTLRNVTAQPQTLTSSVSGAFTGVDIQVTPSTVTLAPGASANVTIDLTVSTAAVPSPKEGSLSFGGLVAWTGGAVPIHVPWAFVKGAFLTIEIRDWRKDSVATILGSRWAINTDWFYGSTRVFWPLEKVDVVVQEFGSPTRGWPDRLLVSEEIDTFAQTQVSVRSGDARFTMAADTVDESGAPLGVNGRECIEQFTLAFPSGRKYTHAQTPDSRAVYGAFSERVKVYPLHSCADASRETVYATLHEPKAGLRGDLVTTQRPQWLRQDVTFAGASDNHMTGMFATIRFPGTAETFYAAGGGSYLMRETRPSLTIYYTKSPGPEVDLLGSVERWSRCYEPSMGHDVDCPYIGHTWMYFNESGVRVDGDLFLDVSPIAYRVPAGRPVVLGGAQRWAQMGFGSSPGFWSAGAMWKGPLGEGRQGSLQNSRTTLRNAAGEILGEDAGYVWKYETLPDGTYHVQSVDRQYAIAGIGGTATLTSTTEITREDPRFPWFTGFRIEDSEGMMASIVGRNESATLLFSITDLQRDWITRQPPREEATRVEYRRRGTAEWHPLTPLVIGRQYLNNTYLFAGVGTVYRVDLSSATREILGAIDIRVHTEDMSGNSAELVLEPALYVGDRPKHRATR